MTSAGTRTHDYIADHSTGPDHRGDYPCQCGLPRRNRAHDTEASVERARAHAEHQRRYGTD